MTRECCVVQASDPTSLMQGNGYIKAGEKRNLRNGIESRKGWRMGEKGRQMVGRNSSSPTDVNGEIVSVY